MRASFRGVGLGYGEATILSRGDRARGAAPHDVKQGHLSCRLPDHGRPPHQKRQRFDGCIEQLAKSMSVPLPTFLVEGPPIGLVLIKVCSTRFRGSGRRVTPTLHPETEGHPRVGLEAVCEENLTLPAVICNGWHPVRSEIGCGMGQISHDAFHATPPFSHQTVYPWVAHYSCGSEKYDD